MERTPHQESHYPGQPERQQGREDHLQGLQPQPKPNDGEERQEPYPQQAKPKQGQVDWQRNYESQEQR